MHRINTLLCNSVYESKSYKKSPSYNEVNVFNRKQSLSGNLLFIGKKWSEEQNQPVFVKEIFQGQHIQILRHPDLIAYLKEKVLYTPELYS